MSAYARVSTADCENGTLPPVVKVTGCWKPCRRYWYIIVTLGIACLLVVSLSWTTNNQSCAGELILDADLLRFSKTSKRHFGPFMVPSNLLVRKFNFNFVNGREYVHHVAITTTKGSRCRGRVQEWHVGGAPGDAIFRWAFHKDTDALSEFMLPEGFGVFLPATACVYVEVHANVEERGINNNLGEIGGLCVGLDSLGSNQTDTESISIAEIAHSHFEVPPGLKDSIVCVQCNVNKQVKVIASRSHAHKLMTKVESVVFREDSTESNLLVSSSPPVSPTFVAMEPHVLYKGDQVQLICHFDTSRQDVPVAAGLSPSRNEMCNQYLMYSSQEPGEWATCAELDRCLF